MDLATIIGLFTILGLLFYSTVLGAGISVYIDIPSLMITVGGSLAALMVSSKMENMKNSAAYQNNHRILHKS